MVRRIVLVALGLLLVAGAASAQVTRSQRVAASERLVIGTNTFGTTSPLQIVGLPAKTSQTDCAWLDASGNVFRGACGGFTDQAANLVFAGPASGGAAAPTFRALVDLDVPDNLTLGTISGTPTFSGAAVFSSTLDLRGAISNTGAANGGYVFVNDWFRVASGFDAQAAIENSSANNSGQVYINDTLLVSGATDFRSSLSNGGALNSGAVHVNDALTVTGNTTLGDATADTVTMTARLASGLTWSSDNAQDIGASGANRPRDLFLARNAVIGGTLGVAGAATLSGAVTFAGGVGSHVLPTATDTYNLGSYSFWWNEGFISQLNAVLFAEATATLFGGYNLVTPNAGAFGAAVSAVATSIDFGKTLASPQNMFVEVRAVDTSGANRVEYMQITSVASCQTCTVSRGLNNGGTGFAFAQGTPYAVNGASGAGRIEINAYTTPRLSVFTQGATYGAKTAVAQLGDLDGAYGYTGTTWGFGAGDYADENVTIDATNGFRLRSATTTRAQLSGTTFTLGDTATEHVSITPTTVQMKNGGTVLADLTDSTLTLGNSTANNAPHVALSANTLSFRQDKGGTDYSMLTMGQDGASAYMQMGWAAANESYLLMRPTSFRMYGNNAERIRLLGDGSGFVAGGNVQWDASGNTTITGRLVVQGDGWNAPGGGNLLRNSQPSSVCGSGPCWYPYNNSGSGDTTTSWGAYCGAANATPVGSCYFYINWNGTNTSQKGILASGGIPWVNVGGASYGTWRKGQWYTVSWWANFGGTGATGMSLAWNTAPSQVVTLMNPTLSGGGWQRYAYAIYWNHGATANNELYITLTGSAGGGELQIAGLQVEHGAVPSGYQPSDQCSGCIVADSIEATAIDGKTITGATFRTTSTDSNGVRRAILDNNGLAFGIGASSGDLGNTMRFMSGATAVSQFGYWNSTAHWWGSAAPTILIGAQSEATAGANEDAVVKLMSNANWADGSWAHVIADGPSGHIRLEAPKNGVQTHKHLFPGYATGTYQNTYGLYRSSTIATGLAINGDLELAGIYKTGGAWLANGGTTTLCDNSGWIYRCNASSRRYKTHIVPAPLDRRVLDLQPVRFDYREPNPVTGEPLPRSLGLIAEDVDALGLRDLVTYQDGQPEAVQYDKLALYLLEVIKDQQRRIEALEAKLKE